MCIKEMLQKKMPGFNEWSEAPIIREWAEDLFKSADRNNSGVLTKKELKNI